MGGRSSKPERASNPLQRMQQKEMQAEKYYKKQQKLDKKVREKQDKNKQKLKHKQRPRKSSGAIKEKPLNQSEYEKKVGLKIRDQIQNDLSTFVLNQISLSVQFFSNYERRRTSIYNENLEKERDLNQHFEEHSIMLQNAVDKSIEERILFRPKHGPRKFESSPLQLQKMYIVFENIEISKLNEANYDSITPICKVDLDTEFQFHKFTCKGSNLHFLESLKWKGYVRLKFKQSDYQRYYRSSVSRESTTSQVESEYIYKPESSGSSAYYTDSEYDYAYIRRLNTHHPLNELTMTNDKFNVDSKILPDTCITNYGEFLQKNDIRDMEEDYSDNEESDTEKKHSSMDRFLYRNTHYLNSKEFLCYFAELLRQKTVLNIALDDATYKGASIFTKKYEIVPAIHVAHNAKNWPHCAYNFRDRERNVNVNDLSGQRFQWPTVDMIKKIETFGYHVIPLPYISKVKKNPFRELEWKIVFPKAERYLESNLSNTQIKVFVLVKVLLKTFLEPEMESDSINPTIDYIRNFLFWECEKSFHSWPEGFLGEVLLRFLKGFLRCIAAKALADFFIVQRNMFESIPDSFLNNIRNVINHIIANPTMHLLMAYRNLTPREEEFLPRISYQKIYKNLVFDDFMGLKMQSIKFKSFRESKHHHYQEETVPELVPVDIPIVAEGFIGKESIKTNGKMRRRTLILKEQMEKKRIDEESRRPSVDSIDLEFFFIRNINKIQKQKDFNCGIEDLRRTNILEHFIDNFLSLAEALIGFKSINQATVYLNQSKRLCDIYRHDYNCENGAIEFLSRREDIEDMIKILRRDGTEFDPPPVPLRISLEPRKNPKRRSTRKSTIKKSMRSRRSVKFSSKVRSFDPRNYTSDSEYEDEGVQEVFIAKATIEAVHLDSERIDRKIEIVDFVKDDKLSNLESKVEESDDDEGIPSVSKVDIKAEGDDQPGTAIAGCARDTSEERRLEVLINAAEGSFGEAFSENNEDIYQTREEVGGTQSLALEVKPKADREINQDIQNAPRGRSHLIETISDLNSSSRHIANKVEFKIDALEDRRRNITSIKDDKDIGDFQTRKNAIQNILEQLHNK